MYVCIFLCMHTYIIPTFIIPSRRSLPPPSPNSQVLGFLFSWLHLEGKHIDRPRLLISSFLAVLLFFAGGDEMEKNPPGTVFKIRKQLLFFWVALAELLVA